MTAKNYINRSVPFLTLSDSVGNVLHMMDESRLSHLPVVSDGLYIGLISEKDCLQQTDPGLPVSAAGIALPVITIREDEHFFSAIELFISQRITILPVTDSGNEYLGSILPFDLLTGLSEILSVNQAGGIIQIEMQEIDYLPSEIAKIVEANDSTVLVMTAARLPMSSTLLITIKINRTEIGPILQTFNRYNYTVRGSWSRQDSYSADLRERFDALMNYLNI